MKRPFDRILVVMFENQYRSYVMQDAFMRKLASAGANLTNFFGCFHPSQTNYLASLAGEICGVTNDTPPSKPLSQQTLADLLQSKGLSWKAYMEAYPGEAWNPAWAQGQYPTGDAPLNEFPNDGRELAGYFRKHNAFASCHSIQSSESAWANIVGDAQFWKDLEGGSLPEYGWYTPDIWNDGHYLHGTHIDTNPRTQLIPQVSTWLEHVFLGEIKASKVQGGSETGLKSLGLNLDIDQLLVDPEAAWEASRVPAGTLIMITFDEADYDAKGYDTNYDGPNQIYTVLLGDMIKPGTVIDTPLNHYSTIKTVEKNFALGDLGKNDRGANWIRSLWNESFSWGSPRPVGIDDANRFSVLGLPGAACLLYTGTTDSKLKLCCLRDGAWSNPVETRFSVAGHRAAAALEGRIHLVFADEKGELHGAVLSSSGEWSEPVSLKVRTQSHLALTGYRDEADGQQKLMLCWQDGQGFIQYLTYAGGVWATEIGEVGQLSDGPMALAQLGASVYLVYKERRSKRMRMTSFNVGPYNAFKAVAFDDSPAPQNDTSLHQWAPTDVSVGHFAKKFAALQNDYEVLGPFSMAAIEGEIHLVNRGAYQDTPTVFSEVFGLTGIVTSAVPYSNGYGTLEQAGWTEEAVCEGVSVAVTGDLALGSDGETLTLVWQDSVSGQLLFKQGAYRSHLDQ